MTKSKRLTDSAGAAVSAVELTPFGDDTGSFSNNRWVQRRMYTSYERDANLSDEAHHRRYNRFHSRFDQPDPYGGSYDPEDPQSLNRYSYTGNDPVNFSDPSGLNMEAGAGQRLCAGYDVWRAWFRDGEHIGSQYVGFVATGPCWGGDGGGLSGGVSQNPTPTEQPKRDDCVNMANRAQEIADGVIKGANAWRGTSARAILQRFNRIFATEFAGAYAGEGVLGVLFQKTRLGYNPSLTFF